VPADTRGRITLETSLDGPRAKELGPAPDAEHWDRLWASTALADAPARGGHLPRQLRATFARRVAPPARVLEAGCGPAHFTLALHALGYDAVGLDWGEDTVRRVRERYPELDLHVGDVRHSPFPDGSFDAVYSPGVCEHFEEGPEEVLRDAWRVLRPGGFAFISTPMLNRLRQRRWRSGRAGADGSFYQYLFTKESLASTLRRIGFDVVEITPYAAWATLTIEWPWLGRLPLGRVAGGFDLLPIVRELGSSCIWTARRPA
jgi:SAM-dependent methyltransferase